MREIVHISTGQCGNQIGTAFWETISAEHNIDGSGRRIVADHPAAAAGTYSGDVHANDKLDVYYSQSGSRYVPRAVLVDLEPGTLDNVKSGPLGDLFRPDNYINALSSAGNNWAKGYYTEGAEILEQVMDVVRREVELTDSLQGFQMTHSLGGGTGSGLGTLLMTNLRDEYADRMIASYSVFPSIDSDTVVEPYNSVLALSQLLESTNETFCLDNHAMYSIFQRNLKISQPSYGDINKLVAQVMSGVTTSLRYPGELNSDLRKLAVNLVPFNRLHFFTVGYAPLFASAAKKFTNLSVPELTQQLLDGRNLMAGVKPTTGKYLTCGAFFRGNVAVKEIEDEMNKYRARNSNLFVDFIPDNVQTSLCSVPPKDVDMTATFVSNTTAISQLFERIHGHFELMFKRKAFLHWFTFEGMDINEFTEAESNIKDLMSDYLQHQDNQFIPDEYEKYDDEEMIQEGYADEAEAIGA
ncbi:hypothetical protein DASB73_027900 [Starmerella bacillaris]|uniref:Tubulin beta chain n=1 Tax=Starmerella bacillaris TaxID=1247836 RepID=A0AAV5RKS1_STABA|nr:hypothetical protein DASB73_027900 [Starmerella bacillaris]